MVNVVAVYIARQFQGSPRVNEHEADEIRFFELENLPKTLNPPDRPVIEQYLDAHSIEREHE